MQTEIISPGAFALVKFNLERGEAIKAESGSMVSKSGAVDLESRIDGGVGRALMRKVFTGDHLFYETLRAKRGSGEALLAPSVPGDVLVLQMDGSTDYFLQKHAFLAGSENIQLSVKMQSLTRGIFSKDGFFVMRVSGEGTLALSSFGAIHEVELAPGESYTVDNGHLVAWTGTTTYTIDKAAKGVVGSITSGEGLVCQFQGPGKIYIQTRNPEAFGTWVTAVVPRRKEGGGLLGVLAGLLS